VGQVPRNLEGRGGFQDSSGVGHTIDAVAMFRAISKHVAFVGDPATFWSHLHDALAAALSGRPGPAVLLVPRDVFALDVPARPAHFPSSLAAFRRAAALPDLSPALEALRAARRPVLLWGPGVARADASEELARLVRALRLPVVTTMADSAAFAHDDPLFLGVIGAAGHPSAHDYLSQRADLLVSVGCDLGAMVRSPIASALERCRVLALASDATSVRHAVPDAQLFEGDPAACLRKLYTSWRESPFRFAELSDYVLSHYAPVLVENGPSDALACSQALSVLQASLPETGYVVFDAGNCAATAIHRLHMTKGLRSTIALGMGGMGYAVAGAIGVQLGAGPRERTVAIVGDGAFLMLGFEVHTAVELGLPILFVVFNDGKHGMCVTRQRLMFGSRFEATQYSALDVATTARGFGPPPSLWIGKAETAQQLASALAEYERLPGARPGVLELVLGREEMPPFAPFLPADAVTIAAPRAGRDQAAA
jgi:acetolactate synthase I/II/III large subunit